MKITGSSIYRYREKRHWNLCWHWLYLFSPHDIYVWQLYTSKWLFKYLDISALLWMFISCPPFPKWFFSYVLCIFLRSSPFAISYYYHHYYYPYYYYLTWNSDFSTSIFQIPKGAMNMIGSSIYINLKKNYWNLC